MFKKSFLEFPGNYENSSGGRIQVQIIKELNNSIHTLNKINYLDIPVSRFFLNKLILFFYLNLSIKLETKTFIYTLLVYLFVCSFVADKRPNG